MSVQSTELKALRERDCYRPLRRPNETHGYFQLTDSGAVWQIVDLEDYSAKRWTLSPSQATLERRARLTRLEQALRFATQGKMVAYARAIEHVEEGATGAAMLGHTKETSDLADVALAIRTRREEYAVKVVSRLNEDVKQLPETFVEISRQGFKEERVAQLAGFVCSVDETGVPLAAVTLLDMRGGEGLMPRGYTARGLYQQTV